jgi:hypothetical protein
MGVIRHARSKSSDRPVISPTASTAQAKKKKKPAVENGDDEVSALTFAAQGELVRDYSKANRSMKQELEVLRT